MNVECYDSSTVAFLVDVSSYPAGSLDRPPTLQPPPKLPVYSRDTVSFKTCFLICSTVRA